MSPSIARRTLKLLMNSSLEQSIYTTTESNEYNLTEKEKEALTFLIDGLEYKEIAMKMSVSPHTVRNHIANIYKKLHVTSRTQAIKVYTK